jgi:hypothetical protein
MPQKSQKKSRKKSKQMLGAALLLGTILAAGLYFFIGIPANSGPLDKFTQCLSEKGGLFYGAFWCPHCQTQKAMFGKSQRFLPYTECSTPDGRTQTPECQRKRIAEYPTWEFAGGSRESGELPLSRLAEKTGCSLPQ